MPTAAGMLQSRNPATGEVVGEVPVTPARALIAARLGNVRLIDNRTITSR